MDNYPHEGLETHPSATVLVVDDEPAIREVIATLLEDEGYLVRHAKDGQEALETINGNQIDLIVSDVVMPRLDGASLVRKLRGRGHVMPVVLMSAVYADVDLPGVRFVPSPLKSIACSAPSPPRSRQRNCTAVSTREQAIACIMLSTPLQAAGPLGVTLTPAEDRDPNRN